MHPLETWRAVVDELPDAAVALSVGRVVFINGLASRLFGTNAGASPPPLEHLFPVREERARVVAAPAGTPLELEARGPDGNRFLADVRCRSIAGSDPPLRICTVRRANPSLNDQRRFRSAVELFELGLFEHDHLTDAIWASRVHRMLYGISPDEELTIPKLLAGLHPDDVNLVAPAILRAHDPTGDGRFDVEHRVIWPNGEIRWVRTKSQTVFTEIDGERRPLLTTGASADQTARKETERDRERIVAVLERTPDFVAIAAPNRSLLYLNRAARELLGVPDDAELSRMKLGNYFTPAAREVLLDKALSTAEHAGVWTGEATLVAGDGREVPVSLVTLAHFRGDDSLERYSAVARDLSRERELEQQLLQSQKMDALGRMAGGAAHDFNNLLSVIIGGTELALTLIPPASPAREELEGVLDASKRATELTQQMLTFSRKAVPRPQVVVDVNGVIRQIEPIVSRLLGKDIQLRMRLAPGAGTIKADPSQLEQIIVNLVVNARDAMPRGGTLTIETRSMFVDERHMRLHPKVKPGHRVVLDVSDSGTGMDAETQARIFEPFFTTKGPGKGTGLGLSTVFGIVTQSGGSIRVDSEPGRGTNFEISFPCTKAPEAPSERASGDIRSLARGSQSLDG